MRHPYIPNRLRSYEQYIKHFHQDLSEMNDFLLWCEGQRAVRALVEVGPRDEGGRSWLVERLQAIEQENSRRKEVKPFALR